MKLFATPALVFDHGDGRYLPDGSFVQRTTLRAFGPGATLPTGMFGHLILTIDARGRETVRSVVQARTAGGRRYDTCFSHDVADAQRRLLRWAQRVLRERAREGGAS